MHLATSCGGEFAPLAPALPLESPGVRGQRPLWGVAGLPPEPPTFLRTRRLRGVQDEAAQRARSGDPGGPGAAVSCWL